MPREPHTGALHLPKDIGLAQSTAQAIENQWNTITTVDARLKAQGIHANDTPNIECPPVTTEALVTTDIKEYTTVFSQQLRWYNYVTRLVADVRAILLQVSNEMDAIEAAKRIHFRQVNEGKAKSDKMSAGEMEDLILQDPHYRDLKLQKQELEQQRIKLDAWCESLDRNLKTVSRQIENRKAEANGGNREANMPGHASGRWEPGRGRTGGSF
jgi:hypothetical protein